MPQEFKNLFYPDVQKLGSTAAGGLSNALLLAAPLSGAKKLLGKAATELAVLEKLLSLNLITQEQAMGMTDLTPNGSYGMQ